MANQAGRPIAPARKLVAAVLGTIACFVMAVGLGMPSWAVVIFGIVLLVLSIALGMLNVVRRGARAWVVGTAQVKGISPPPTSSAVYGRAEIAVLVIAPGLQPSEVTIRDPRVPVVKWPLPGDTLPITVDVDDLRRVRINWDEAAPQDAGADPPPPPPVDYAGTDPEDDLDDDLLGDVEPPPWAARDRQWGRGPDEPAPDYPDHYPDANPVVVHDTPAGRVVEGELVSHEEAARQFPPRSAATSPDADAVPPADADPMPAEPSRPGPHPDATGRGSDDTDPGVEPPRRRPAGPPGPPAGFDQDFPPPPPPGRATPDSDFPPPPPPRHGTPAPDRPERDSPDPAPAPQPESASGFATGPPSEPPPDPAPGFAAGPPSGFASGPASGFASEPSPGPAAESGGRPSPGPAHQAASRPRPAGRRPSPHPRGGTATATVDPETATYAYPGDEPVDAGTRAATATRPPDQRPAAATPTQRTGHPDDARPIDLPADEPEPVVQPASPPPRVTMPQPRRRPEPTQSATTATPSPMTSFPTAPAPTAPPPTAPRPDRPARSGPAPVADDRHDDIDLPLDGEPTPETTPSAAAAVADDLITRPAEAAPAAEPTHAEPDTTTHAEPMTPTHTEPDPTTHAEPITPTHTKPDPTTHAEPITPTHTKPDPTTHAEPITAARTEPGTLADIEPGTAARTEPVTPARTRFVSNAAHDASAAAPPASRSDPARGVAAVPATPPAADKPDPDDPVAATPSPGGPTTAAGEAKPGGVVAGAAAAVTAVAAAAVAVVRRVGKHDEPVTPEPVAPEPVTPEPVTPEPVTPEPVTPEPVTPEPVTPEPVTPEPARETAAPVAATDDDRASVVEVPTPSASTTPVAERPLGGAWADLPATPEPDEHADDLITAYPSARPGPTGAIHGVGITILVTDLHRSVAFYRDTLGFYEIDSGACSAVLASGDTRLVLRTVTGQSAGAGRFIYLNLEVGDVEAIYRELLAKGVPFVHPPQAVNRGDRLELWSATFRDPDDHNIAITQWRAIR